MKLRKLCAAAASLPRLWVLMSVAPRNPTSFQPRSSATIWTKFGLRSVTAVVVRGVRLRVGNVGDCGRARDEPPEQCFTFHLRLAPEFAKSFVRQQGVCRAQLERPGIACHHGPGLYRTRWNFAFCLFANCLIGKAVRKLRSWLGLKSAVRFGMFSRR